MTSRVAAAIDAANAEGRGAFVGYLPIGFPDLATSIEAAVALAENGADILELGPPYSDPVMDGTVIQEATQAALAAGFRLRDTFTAVRAITERVDVPVLVMTYWNPVLQYGVDRYADDLLAAGGAGLITPDITPDAAGEWIAASRRTGLDRDLPGRPDLDRRATRAHRREQHRLRVHGLDDGDHRRAGRAGCRGPHPHRAPARAPGTDGEDLRACVGIGISTADQVSSVLDYADGAIVGTALVRALRDGGVEGLAETTRALVAGTRPTHPN